MLRNDKNGFIGTVCGSRSQAKDHGERNGATVLPRCAVLWCVPVLCPCCALCCDCAVLWGVPCAVLCDALTSTL